MDIYEEAHISSGEKCNKCTEDNCTSLDDNIALEQAINSYINNVSQKDIQIRDSLEAAFSLVAHRLLDEYGKGQIRHGTESNIIRKESAYNELIAQGHAGFAVGQIRKKALEAYILHRIDDDDERAIVEDERAIVELADCIGYAIFAMQYIADAKTARL